MTPDRENSGNNPIVLFAFAYVFVLVIIAAHLVRGRSFWGDEAAVMDNLMTRSPGSILFGGALAHAQQFPKVYLALIAVVTHLFGFTTFWARLCPLVFGLGAFAVWLWVFLERYAGSEKWAAQMVACGMLVVSVYPLYYLHELKPYSAELFFSGILLALYQTSRITERTRLAAIVILGLLSFLFGYATLWVTFIIWGLILANHLKSDDKKWPPRLLIAGVLISVPLLWFLYHIDYSAGLQSGVLHEYWSSQFVMGKTALERLQSLHELYWHFLFKWWLTDWGPLSEKSVPSGSWFIWPGQLFHNPDLKNGLYGLIFVVMALHLRRWREALARRDVMMPAILLLGAMAGLAGLKRYPWGMSRLSLYAMPVAILLIVEAVSWVHAWVGKWMHRPALGLLLWAPFFWLIMRNGVFLGMAFATGHLPEDINPAMRRLDPAQSRYLIVADTTELVMRTYEHPPATIQILSQARMNQEGMPPHLGKEPAYYLWAHGAPAKNAAGVPNDFQQFYRSAETVYTTHQEFGPELLLLKPAARPNPLSQ